MITQLVAALTQATDSRKRALWIEHPHEPGMFVHASPLRASKTQQPFRPKSVGSWFEDGEPVIRPLTVAADVARYTEWCKANGLYPETRTREELELGGASFYVVDISHVPASERANL